MAKKKKPNKANRPGPKPETIVIQGDWEQAVKVSLSKEKPKKGWPK